VGIPSIQKARIGAYIFKRLLAGKQRYPLVLMLEPLFLCNLSCKGCGKIDHPKEVLEKRLSVRQCVDAVEECGAPVVSIPGGEPLLHPDIHIIVRELINLKKYVYLCTNSLLVKERIEDFKPSLYLTFNIHLDGFKERHDTLANRDGTFDTAVDSIRLLISRGFRVTTNTTFFHGETPENASRLLDFLSSLGVEGMTISTCFSYENASAQNIFLDRKSTSDLFRKLFQIGKVKGWQFNHSSLYLDFLAGNQRYACTPWGNPTRNIFGWQKPCYLLNDGYAATFKELMETTEWDKYGAGNDPRCVDCMVHCGFEPTAVMDAVSNPMKALAVSLRMGGHRIRAGGKAFRKQPLK